MNYSKELILIIIILLILLCIAYSPLLSLFISIMILSLGDNLTNFFRYFLSILSIFYISIISASRNFNSVSSSDDFINVYWPHYLEINSLKLFEDDFSKNGEFIYSLYLNLINNILGRQLSQYDLFFILCFFGITIFYIWLEKFGLKFINKNKKGLCVAVTLIFFEFFITTQLIRQFYASIFILFSLAFWYERKIKISLVLYILSIFTHFSSLAVLPIFIMMMSSSFKVKIYLLVGSIIFTGLFYSFINYALNTNLLGLATYKLLYYDAGLNKNNAELFMELKYLILALILLSICRFLKKDIMVLTPLTNILVLSVILFSVFSIIPELSNRLFLIMLYILPGYFISVYGIKMGNSFRFIFLIYLFFYIINISVFRGYELSINSQSDFLGLWYNYNWVDDSLFYYLKEF